MNLKTTCGHLASATNIPLSSILNYNGEKSCADCECPGPDLWVCLYRNCLRLGCSSTNEDHSTLHNKDNPTHCVHMNLSNHRIWCYKCETEIFLESLSSHEEDDADVQSSGKSVDSGTGSYLNLQQSHPIKSNVYAFEKTVGLNVNMNGGDSSDCSDSEDGPDSGRPAGLVGLQNIGNTCYMNAALQALSNAAPLTRFFLDCPAIVHILSEGKKPGLSRIYQILMKDIWLKRNGGYVTPSGILYGIRSVHPMFRGYHQHDTQEFLRNFMDQLHEELKQQCAPESCSLDTDTFAMAIEEPTVSSNYDSSEGEYETCDSGVSERSSLSDDTEAPSSNAKRRLSRSASPNRRQKARLHSANVIDCQPSTSSSVPALPPKKQIKFRSIISDIFDGKLLSSVQCLTCNRVSSRIETFQDLSLPIPSRDHLLLLHGRGPGPGVMCSEAVIPVQDGWITWILTWLKSWFYGPTVTLHDCLAAFFSTDELKGDNMYSCEKCNKLRNGIKFSKVLQLPEVLCIHLKRFRHELMFSSKISFAVSFPLKGLDMKPYLHADCVSRVTNYELFSVICHHGTAGGGHYISFALNAGEWYEFDDQCVTRVSPEKVESCEAYVLFYRKVTKTADEARDVAIKISRSCLGMSQDIAYISKQWISRFHTCAEPGPIDNSDFLCQHGSINPEREPILKELFVVLPVAVYKYLHKLYGGCPPITGVHICPACLAFQKRLLLEMETFLQLGIKAENRDLPLTHLISVSWYGQWHSFVYKKNNESPGPIDNSKIDLSREESNDAIEVPEEMWHFFHGIYGGGPEIRINRDKEKSDSDENNVESETEETTRFVIPSLKKAEVGVVDKTMYNHGEPANVDGNVKETMLGEDVVSQKVRGAPPEVNNEVPNCSNINLFPSSRSSNNCSAGGSGEEHESKSSASVSNDANRRRRKMLDCN